VTIVWIARRFTDEHQATIEWLNEVTGEKINFFGLEVELWKIASSPIAPKFNVVAKPNEWTKGGGGTKRLKQGDLTATQTLYLEFWTEFRKYVQSRSTSVKPQRPQPASYMNTALGTGRAFIIFSAAPRDKKIGACLVIRNQDRLAFFHLLKREEEQIEKELGGACIWHELPDKKTSYICQSKPDSDPQNKNDWEAHFEFLLKTAEQFRSTFAERIKSLNPEDYQPESEPE